MPRINFDDMPYEKIVDTGDHVVISGGYYSPDPNYKDDETIYKGYYTFDSFRVLTNGYCMGNIPSFDEDGKIIRTED